MNMADGSAEDDLRAQVSALWAEDWDSDDDADVPRGRAGLAGGLGMGGHQSHAMKSDQWLTPRFILDALGPFDLDPCAAPDPDRWPTARNHITLPRDGLAAPWFGRVWLNPPYGNDTWRWLAWLAAHGRGTALIFARTETEGFHRCVWNRATSILFLRGRLVFHRPDGSLPGASRGGANAGAPSCLVAYGVSDAEVLADAARSVLPGAYISGWELPPPDPPLF